ncbi:hypothetical protein V6N13_140143 [Hibiscus sabdariffa]|uniref:Uncharacterized protein n=1 Tax=Hibiscus sabdariffa TaxID=183260 RepID=A0ABR2AX30_9ROSI
MATKLHEEVLHVAAVIPQTNAAVDSNLKTNEGNNMVVARDKVVIAPPTLQANSKSADRSGFKTVGLPQKNGKHKRRKRV